jgi:hypothetical protein
MAKRLNIEDLVNFESKTGTWDIINHLNTHIITLYKFEGIKQVAKIEMNLEEWNELVQSLKKFT